MCNFNCIRQILNIHLLLRDIRCHNYLEKISILCFKMFTLFWGFCKFPVICLHLFLNLFCFFNMLTSYLSKILKTSQLILSIVPLPYSLYILYEIPIRRFLKLSFYIISLYICFTFLSFLPLFHSLEYKLYEDQSVCAITYTKCLEE